jgi:hypothetical protein
MELREISTSIKESNKQVLKTNKVKGGSYVFGIIAIVAVLNFSIPLFYNGLQSYQCLFVNTVEFIESTIFINLKGGQAASPENYVKNVRY